MAQHNIAEQETLGEAMNKTEFFFERNGKKLSYVFIALLAAAALVYGYRALIVQPRAEKAAEMITAAQNRFEAQTPDFELALIGDANGAGFLEVVEQYGSTPSGNLAKHYAGICYLRMGDYQNALAFLKKYENVDGIPGALLNAQNLGLQGDVYAQQDNYKEAVSLYEKAVAASDNSLTAPYFLKKAGMVYEKQGDYAKALAAYKRISVDYPASMEARDVQKYIGRAEQQL